MNLGGYRLGERLHASHRSVVTRARSPEGDAVIIKHPAPGERLEDSATRFRNERAIYARVSPDHSATLRAYVEFGGVPALVFEDEGLVPLVQHVEAEDPSLAERLRLGLAMLDSLAAFHARKLIHRDFKPANLLVDPAGARVVLIDFGGSTVAHTRASAPARLEGTLEYIAPELTGRINQPVDHRSDYYCFGATLYWLLCGEPPFGTGGAGELVHAHIARQPRRLDAREPSIPAVLAHIVAKLLAKSAGARYQSALGLRLDLERCLRELETRGTVGSFELASIDPAVELHLPARLLARPLQVEALALAWEVSRAADEPTLALVYGPRGSVTEALVEAFMAQPELAPSDQLHHVEVELGLAAGEPLAAVRGLIQPLLRRYQADPEAHRLAQARLSETLLDTGSTLIEFIPELATFLADAPRAPAADIGGARDRLWNTVARLAAAILLPGHAYLLSLRQVSAEDEAARHLVTALLGGGRQVFVLLSSSEGEALGELRALADPSAARVVELEPPPVTEHELRGWLGDQLAEAELAPRLAGLLHARTNGLPAFVSQYLHALHEDGVITLDPSSGRWRVELERAELHEGRGDLAGFIAARFAELPAAAQRVLGLAAQVAPQFSASTLAAIGQLDLALVDDALLSAAGAGFLAPTPGGGFCFAHAHAHAAAVASLGPLSAELHLRCARALRGHIGPDQPDEEGSNLHALAVHAGAGQELLSNADEREAFAVLCARAGERARAGAEFEAAAAHFEAAASLSAGDDARLTYHIVHAECASMAGDLERAEAAYRRARDQAKTRAARARILTSRAVIALVPQDNERALAVLDEAAALFELDLRRHGSPDWVGAMFGEVLGALAVLDDEAIVAGPILAREDIRELLRLCTPLTTASYMVGDFNLATALILTSVRASIDHGYCAESAAAIMQLALILVSGPREFEAGRRYANLCFALFERFPDPGLQAMAMMVYSSTVRSWLEPLVPGIEDAALAYQQLRAAGRYSDAGYATNTVALYSVYLGQPLPETLTRAEAAYAYMRELGASSAEVATQTTVELCRVLMTRQPESELILDPKLDLSQVNASDLFFIQTNRAFLAWLMRDAATLAAALSAVEPIRVAGTGMLSIELLTLFKAARLRDLARVDVELRDAEAAALDEDLARLDHWVASCPSTATPIRELVAGYQAEARGQLDEAFARFDAAASAAEVAGLPSFEAIANELAGEVLLARAQPKFAVGYFDHAQRCYARWGASGLRQRLQQRLQAVGEAVSMTASSTSSSSDHELQLPIDVASIVKMSQAMAEVTSVDEVIDHLLGGSIENAGADRGLFLRPSATGLQIAGVLTHGASPSSAELDRDLGRELGRELDGEGVELLVARSIVHLALASGEPVVVDDAPVDERCASDRRVIEHAPRSLLALPIRQQSGRASVLYLENRGLDGVFSALDLEVLATLARQAAIALERASLFDALREREAQWRSLVDNAPDFISILDRDHRFTFLNRVSYGLTLDQVIGRRIQDMTAPASLDRLELALERVFVRGEVDAYDSEFPTPTGLRVMSTRIGPIKRGDKVERAVVVSTDRTAQRELEAQLAQAQKMQAIGTLAGGVAHDFNNLLTVIRGASELAMLDAGDNEALRESLDEIVQASDRATQLTRQLLAFSRKSVLKPENIELGGLVTGLTKLLGRLLGERVELCVALWSDACRVHIDRGQLEQVLMNLVVNANDAMPEGGTIDVRTAQVEVGAGVDPLPPGHLLMPGSYVLLEVRDSGPGIPEPLLGHIFEPFFTTKPTGQGTGLGLSTVLGIVEQSGGRVYVDNRDGAVFSIYLPRVELGGSSVEEAEAGPLAGEDGSSSSATILLVEDEDQVRRLGAKLLEREGYEVLQAAGGEEALAIAERTPLALLVVDVIMPGERGPEVAARVQALQPEVPVLFVSGYTDDAIVRHGVRDGTQAFLQKPFTSASLLAAVREALASTSQAQEPPC